ncbi:MAG: hypothetical protein ACR2LE_01890 [Nocardioidaceae bacterium]
MAEKGSRSVDVSQLVDELRSTVDEARSMPMSSSVVVNKADVLARIDVLQEALPQAFAESERVFAGRDTVLADAHSQADRIVEEATQERDRLISDSEVYRVAKRQAEAEEQRVERECEALRRETDEYVDGRLANLEITLTKTLEAVTRGRNRLQGRSALDHLDEEGSDTAFAFPS